jgi:hypothetical protein
MSWLLERVLTCSGLEGLVCSLGVLIVVASAPELGAAEASWKDLGASDLPARVEAIIFADGKRLDVNSSLRWGRWTVKYGAKPINAVLSECNDRPCRAITIQDLVCGNAVDGEYDNWRSPKLAG